MIEERRARAMWSKSKAGNWTPRFTIPKRWADVMGITPEERNIITFFDEEKKEIRIIKETEKENE